MSPAQPKKVAFMSAGEDDILIRSMDSGRSVSGAFKVMQDASTKLQQVSKIVYVSILSVSFLVEWEDYVFQTPEIQK